LEALWKLCSQGWRKKVIILSNSSDLAETAQENLPGLGFEPKHFVWAVTSGQEACFHLQQTYGRAAEDATTKVLFFTWDDPSTSPKVS
jgi:hypothetical protein